MSKVKLRGTTNYQIISKRRELHVAKRFPTGNREGKIDEFALAQSVPPTKHG